MTPFLPLLLACSAPAPEHEASADPRQGDTLVAALAFDPGNANPLVIPYVTSQWITTLVNPGLALRTVSEAGLAFEPGLAESWSWNEDGTELTYLLQPDRLWEDGTPITADDVVFTWSLIADPDVASNWHGDAKRVQEVRARGPHTVVWTFDTPRNPVLQQGLTFRGIVPEHVLKDADRSTLRGHPTARAPVASGPFRVARWEPDIQVVLEPNPRAPAALRPHLDRVVFRILPEYNTRLLELEAGRVDFLWSVEYADVARLKEVEHLRVMHETARSMQYIGYKLEDPRFSDLRVRRALTHALDRDELIEDLLTADGVTYGRPCTSTVSPEYVDWAADIEPLPHDPALAKELLAAAGWTDTDGDGVLDREGEPLTFTLMIQHGYAKLKRLGVYVQAQLAKIGVKVELDIVEPTRFSVRAREKDFEAILWAFGADPKVDPTPQWRSDGQYNWFGYHNPEVDALIDQGVGTVDLAEAQAAFRKVQQLVYADQPATFLYWEDEIIAVHRRFEDVSTDVYTGLLHLERWYVPREKQKYR